MFMIYLSIIIPVFNEENFIVNTLLALINQDYPKDRFEIIVVDGNSTDDTRTVVEQFITAHFDFLICMLDNPHRLSSAARNIGIRNAKGHLIAVIDAHVYIPTNKLFKNMERLKEKNTALCLARPAPLDIPGLIRGKSMWIAVARKCWLGHSLNSSIYSNFEGFVDPTSSGFAYDKSIFNQVGYFDESFDAAEDVEFHFRLKMNGIMAYTSPDLLIYSYPRESFSALFKQQVRYGEGRAKFIKKHPRGFTIETLFPALICVCFLSLPLTLLCGWHLTFWRIFHVSIISLYSAAILITGLREALIRKRFFPGIVVALAVWVTHVGLGWGFIKTILRFK